MTEAQFNGLARHFLTVAGSIAGTVAVVNPAWGVAAQAAIGGAGVLVTAIATIWSFLAPEKQASN